MLDAVELHLRGLMLEKLMERAMEEGARFTRVLRMDDRQMCMILPEKDAKILEELAERYGVRCTKVREDGRAKWRKTLLRRISLPVSLLLCAALSVCFLSRIWGIEVRPAGGGASAQVMEQVERAIQDAGVCVGMRAGALDTDALSSTLRAAVPELTFAGVSVRGVYLLVDVAQEDAAPDVYDIEKARDLVAARDAIVERCDALSGHACVQPGDAVRRGQTLILGEERVSAEEVRPVRAQGAVWAKIWFEGECTLPLGEEVSVRTGRSVQESSLQFFSLTLPLRTAQGFLQQETEEELLPIGGVFLPLRIVRRTHWETERAYQTYDQAETIELAGQTAIAAAREQIPSGAQEIDVWTDTKVENNRVRVRAVVEARGDIASTRGDLRDD